MSSTNPSSMTREQFLKAGALGAGALAAGALVGAPAAALAAEQAAHDAASVGGPWAFEIAPDPIADDQISEVKEAEIIVVGADTVGMLLNSEGKRFHAEGLTFGQYTMLFPHVHGGTIYQIWDSAYAETGAPWPKSKTAYGSPLSTAEEKIAGWDASVEKGTYVKADTVEEVIELLGLPAETIDEVNKYNGFCEAGEDTDFFKYPGFLKPITQPPFYGYAGGTMNIMHTVLGGLRTDINMRMCDAADQPIPGLYNVGTMVGDSYAGCYDFVIPGHNLGMNCICYGYLTGKFIAENE